MWPSHLAVRASALSLALGLGIVAVAWNNRLLERVPACVLAGVLVGLLLALRRPAMRSWLACAGLTFLLLLVGVWLLLPAYQRQFALRQQLHASRDQILRGRVPVICVPSRWDSVRFYLPDAQVLVFGTAQRAELLLELQAHPEVVLVAKSGRLLNELLSELPDSLEWALQTPQGAVTVAWVRKRHA